MEKALDNTIIRAAEEARVDPRNAVLSADLSNVMGWEAENDNVVNPSTERVSVYRMSTYFQSLATRPLVRVFSPHVYTSDEVVREITGWVMETCPEILNSAEFADQNQSNSSYNSRLAKAIRGYMASRGESVPISAAMRSKISTLTRSETWFEHRDRLQASGFEVYGKPVGYMSKSLVDDKAYTSVVTNMLQVVDGVQRNVEEMLGVEGRENVGEAELLRLKDDLDKSSQIFDRVSAYMTPEELAQIGDMMKLFRSKISSIGQAAEHIKDQILHGSSRKCDLDVDIVAATMDPEVLRKYGVFVFYSGDGDFGRMYRLLADQGKRVVVVSPDAYLARSVKTMAATGEVIWHRPNFDDRIWRSVRKGSDK